MASITIQIQDAELQRVLNRFAEAHGYQRFVEQDPTLPPIANPESKFDFLRRMLIERIRRAVLEQEVLNAPTTFRGTQKDPGIEGLVSAEVAGQEGQDFGGSRGRFSGGD